MRLDMFKKVKRMKTIYRNGTILTMNEEALYAQALWEEDGRIGGLGSEEEILAMKHRETGWLIWKATRCCLHLLTHTLICGGG